MKDNTDRLICGLHMWKTTTVVVVLAVITLSTNIIMYNVSNLIIISSSERSQMILIADFGDNSKNNVAQTTHKYSTDQNSVNSAKVPVFHRAGSDYPSPSTDFNLVSADLIQILVNGSSSQDDQYVITPEQRCLDVELVMCVMSSRDNFVQRQAIRQTWGGYAKDKGNSARLFFFLGSEDPSTEPFESTQSLVENEAKIFGDVLQANFVDSYRNLTLKSISILQWVSQHCRRSRFLLKSDDDVYVNVPFLVRTLKDMQELEDLKGIFLTGFVYSDASPIRDGTSKWYTPYNLYKESEYPMYVSGTAYAMTVDAARLLFKASNEVPFFWLEDVFITGLCAKKAGVRIVNSKLFVYHRLEPKGCSLKSVISGHKYTSSELAKIHNELYDDTATC
ncbi:beta-1 3-galactosyltransferase 5 [Biomphalaria pfeifferi]|uniref:Hexosyltransferase n=1 Tax=Biomphalaria pfeifferi TaxID=112525 RepID=A0AAD8C759_BIOPF|nr:beta-1 3-galactosyltransferase 5 [Biomphalaria pfeifferi]